MPEQYKERLMDGRLWMRNSPSDPWKEVSYEELYGRMLIAERALDRLTKEYQKVKAAVR